VLFVAEAAAGFSDSDVLALALREMRLLLTGDKDFGDLVFRRERAVPGIVLMRFGPENFALKATRLLTSDRCFGSYLTPFDHLEPRTIALSFEGLGDKFLMFFP
jgi:Domain of unknown function (DUF5615)